ncbi:6-phosphofructokinase [Gorgonomyces haynaldii]|nr:6-phosphofructokinase [Gorgonomyces haynaldii]
MNEFRIQTLGTPTIQSHLETTFVADSVVLAHDPLVSVSDRSKTASFESNRQFHHFELGGPRKELFFDPKTTVAGIVCCGGLCPAINNVIRGLVHCLVYRYHVSRVLGFRYGYEGMVKGNHEPLDLTPEFVKDIPAFGGCVLGTSRGPQDINKMLDYLIELGVSMVFTIGGDGTLKGALALSQAANQRNYKISVVGIPKTVDNDVMYLEKTFGFDTAVEMAQPALRAAHEESRAHNNGIGIVKLMGRDSGFIALHSAIANADVNCLLIPEKKFTVEKLIQMIEKRFEKSKHFVICVAEGAGQELCNPGKNEQDASGNKKYADVGQWLVQTVGQELKKRKIEHTIKYLDPSYAIRTAPANSADSIFTIILAQMAVHAAMAGKTQLIVGRVQGHFCHIPIEKAVEKRKTVDVTQTLYQTFVDGSGMSDLE